VQRVGCLALAVDLAGAYISNEPDQEAALMQYIGDYDRHQDELLQDDSVCGLLPTKKTMRTVWDTTLDKLQKDHGRLRPNFLFVFFACFKGAIVQDEMFRLASIGAHDVGQKLGEGEWDYQARSDSSSSSLTENGTAFCIDRAVVYYSAIALCSV
jgi:hypothetical protein